MLIKWPDPFSIKKIASCPINVHSHFLHFLKGCGIGKIERGVSPEKESAINYDSEGGVYPADIMTLAVLLNSD